MSKAKHDSFKTRSTLTVGSQTFAFYDLTKLPLELREKTSRLPVSLRILVENLLRTEDGENVRRQDIEPLIGWDPKTPSDREISFTPARVLLQDFTGVPAIVDLAAMRDAMARMGGDPAKINPIFPLELVIDHSVQVDHFGAPDAFRRNVAMEFERNRERYAFLRWGQQAFNNLRVVPPGTGIVHQVNLEYLARVVFESESAGGLLAYPDTLVGTDSHTPMVNGLGVLGWGVGGIEAEAAMLGQPIAMLIPEVVGFRLKGELPEGATATDLVLTVTRLLRAKGVVGKFVEFYGPGLSRLAVTDRATISNMSPEFGATCTLFPIDQRTLDYLRFTGRSDQRVALVEAYARAQGIFRADETPDPVFSDTVELDLSTIVPCLAGPKRPQDQVALSDAKPSFQKALASMLAPAKGKEAAAPATSEAARVRVRFDGTEAEIGHGAVVIAAITSCTNTSNPSVMVAAGLLAKKAVERGLTSKPWVKTSLAPGSQVVTEYLKEAGVTAALDALGFHLVGYGCTTCIGNSGPLPEAVSKAIEEGKLVAAAVLSGNRNFEGRVHPEVRANYLASPPLVVAYALAGRMDLDLTREPIGRDRDGRDVYLKDIWPTSAEVERAVAGAVKAEMYRRKYADVFHGEDTWRALPIPEGNRYAWDPASTYIREPPFFQEMPKRPRPLKDIAGMRVLAVLGDSITTDHISPAGEIPDDGPAGRYLIAAGVRPEEFNQYGTRRGNHEVMVRGTFANIRLKNLLVPGVEGGFTRHPSSAEPMPIYDAAMRYQKEKVPLLIVAGKEYGSGSSRDWAAKGPRLLGVRAVVAESFERIHRSNLVGLGILPLQFQPGENRETLGLTGFETYDIVGLKETSKPGAELLVRVHGEGGATKEFKARVRLDTPNEVSYFRHGGILQYVLRSML